MAKAYYSIYENFGACGGYIGKIYTYAGRPLHERLLFCMGFDTHEQAEEAVMDYIDEHDLDAEME